LPLFVSLVLFVVSSVRSYIEPTIPTEEKEEEEEEEEER
jgi:hypothetical protein